MTTATTSVREFKPSDQPFFERLYKDWFRAHFHMAPEPVDEYVLTKPEEAILSHGGFILIATTADGEPAGTVALKKADSYTHELTKMAVREDLRGQGVGGTLCAAAIEKAKAMGIRRIVLYTHSSLPAAILLYKRHRFTNVPLEPGTYSHLRCDTKMELWLDADHQ